MKYVGLRYVHKQNTLFLACVHVSPEHYLRLLHHFSLHISLYQCVFRCVYFCLFHFGGLFCVCMFTTSRFTSVYNSPYTVLGKSTAGGTELGSNRMSNDIGVKAVEVLVSRGVA